MSRCGLEGAGEGGAQVYKHASSSRVADSSELAANKSVGEAGLHPPTQPNIATHTKINK